MIKLSVNNLTKNNNVVFGKIYFKEDDFYFPSSDWNDFPVVITNWWCISLFKLLSNEKFSEELVFMDGPFSIRIDYLEESKFEFYLKEQDSIIKKIKIKVSDFICDFLKKINSLIRYLNDMKWKGKDINELKINFSKLQKKVKVVYQTRA